MKKYSMETTVGIFVVLGLICIGYMTVKLGKVTFFGGNTYTLYAPFASASGLRAGSPVEVYGIEVGSIERLGIDPKREMALVEMKINQGVQIYDDATATVKTAGLIGDKLIKIDPGGAGELLKPGGTLVNTSTPPDIDELIGKYAFGDVKKDAQKPDK